MLFFDDDTDGEEIQEEEEEDGGGEERPVVAGGIVCRRPECASKTKARKCVTSASIFTFRDVTTLA